MFVAAQEGHVQILDYLLRYGAQVNQQNKDGDTPLLYACLNRRKEAIQWLLSHGAKVHISNNVRDFHEMINHFSRN